MSDSPHYQRAIEQIDRANSLDPNPATVDGQQHPAELIYSARMIACLARLEPGASEALRLAVRCQHLRRWEIPRSDYPMTRPGYHQWRTRLAKFHADEAGAILASVGYDPATITRVQSLIRKERFKTDAEAQTLEDVACLVFLELDYADFARRHDDQKVIHILQKTWRKMSDRGHVAALELAGKLAEPERRLIERAISPL